MSCVSPYNNPTQRSPRQELQEILSLVEPNCALNDDADGDVNVSPFYAGNQPDGYRSIKCKKSFAHCGHFTKYVQHGHLWALHQDADDADVLWLCPHFTVRGSNPTVNVV